MTSRAGACRPSRGLTCARQGRHPAEKPRPSEEDRGSRPCDVLGDYGVGLDVGSVDDSSDEAVGAGVDALSVELSPLVLSVLLFELVAPGCVGSTKVVPFFLAS